MVSLKILQATTKLVDDVRIEIISMQILSNRFAPQSHDHYVTSLHRNAPILSVYSKKPLVISAVKDGFNPLLSVSKIVGILQYDDDD